MESLVEITSPIETALNLFECELRALLEKEDNFLKDDLISFMFNKPKRLRVIFIFLFAKLLEIESDSVMKIAIITELIHSASLIHDDIIDCAIKRRDLPCFYKKYDSKIAVLEGDLLLSMALDELSNTSLEILKIFSAKIKATLNGELKQDSNFNKVTNIDTYLDKTFNKTGNLFLAGLLSLFTLKEIDEKTKNNLINFMTNYSIAFQINNDIKNCSDINSDFTNGNYTLAVIYSTIENKVPSGDIEQKYIDMAKKKRDEFKLKALSFLKDFPKSRYKEALLKLGAEF